MHVKTGSHYNDITISKHHDWAIIALGSMEVFTFLKKISQKTNIILNGANLFVSHVWWQEGSNVGDLSWKCHPSPIQQHWVGEEKRGGWQRLISIKILAARMHRKK